MLWHTGNWSSYPSDGRAFIERDSRGWWVYSTDLDGRIASDEPLHPEPFASVDAAIAWAEANVPARI